MTTPAPEYRMTWTETVSEVTAWQSSKDLPQLSTAMVLSRHLSREVDGEVTVARVDDLGTIIARFIAGELTHYKPERKQS